MRVVFLDLDGVVVTNWSWDKYNIQPTLYPMEPPPDPNAIKNLNELAKKYSDLRFVLSSSWRRLHLKDAILGYLSGAGFEGEFHNDWCTPPPNSEGFRGDEINAWLKHQEHQERQESEIQAIICLDDKGDFYPEQNLIKIDPEVGFTEEDLHKVTQKLDEHALLQKLCKLPSRLPPLVP